MGFCKRTASQVAEKLVPGGLCEGFVFVVPRRKRPTQARNPHRPSSPLTCYVRKADANSLHLLQDSPLSPHFGLPNLQRIRILVSPLRTNSIACPDRRRRDLGLTVLSHAEWRRNHATNFPEGILVNPGAIQ